MSVRHYRRALPAIGVEMLAAWEGVGTAEVSDCLDRGMAMAGAIGPIAPGMRLVGRARTVRAMVADNSAVHAALQLAVPGDVLVVDAQGFDDVAVWGGLMARAALARGIAGLVVDGRVRDSEEIAELGFAVFARGAVPRGPHKGFGGEVDGRIACGGVPVAPGDLVVGDGDGVVVVPSGRIAATLEAVRALQARERATIARIEAGESLGAIYGVPEVVSVEG